MAGLDEDPNVAFALQETQQLSRGGVRPRTSPTYAGGTGSYTQPSAPENNTVNLSTGDACVKGVRFKLHKHALTAIRAEVVDAFTEYINDSESFFGSADVAVPEVRQAAQREPEDVPSVSNEDAGEEEEMGSGGDVHGLRQTSPAEIKALLPMLSANTRARASRVAP